MKVQTKYNGTVDFVTYQEYTVKNIFKILPLKEEGKEWQKYLEGLLVELSGFDSLVDNVHFIALISKLEGLLTIPEEDATLFRKTVFDSIDMLKKIQPSEKVL